MTLTFVTGTTGAIIAMSDTTTGFILGLTLIAYAVYRICKAQGCVYGNNDQP